jgi:hypothetical protein
VVSDFDCGSFITPDAHMFTYPIQFEQLCYADNRPSKFSYYPQNELLNFVASIHDQVFGTAFVAYSAYDFVNFSKQYSKDNIFHIGICNEECTGFNSLLLSPTGIDWAKNFNRIIFLSPVLDEGFIAELGLHTNAEIFVPMERELDRNRFQNLDLSRETFGKIFNALTSRPFGRYYSIFDIYQAKLKGQVGFDAFYAAFLVFKELGLIIVKKDETIIIERTVGQRKNLSESRLYNKFLLLKNTLGAV